MKSSFIEQGTDKYHQLSRLMTGHANQNRLKITVDEKKPDILSAGYSPIDLKFNHWFDSFTSIIIIYRHYTKRYWNYSISIQLNK